MNALQHGVARSKFHGDSRSMGNKNSVQLRVKNASHVINNRYLRSLIL